MSIAEYSDPYLIDSLRIFHGMSLRKLAKESSLDAGSLSFWIRGIENRVSLERLKPAMTLLGLGEEGLIPGIHRWTASSPLNEDIERVEKTVSLLLLGGGTVIQVRRAGILNPLTNESFSPFVSFVSWILIPDYFPDVRIILKIAPHRRFKQIINFPSLRTFSPANFGKNWQWFPKDNPQTDNPAKWITLSSKKYKTMMENNDLSIEVLDTILGLYRSDWTWNSLLSRLKKIGETPNEVADILVYAGIPIEIIDEINPAMEEVPDEISKRLFGELDIRGSIAAEDQLETENGSSWTWELVVSKAKESGLTPMEVAEKLRLSK